MKQESGDVLVSGVGFKEGGGVQAGLGLIWVYGV